MDEQRQLTYLGIEIEEFGRKLKGAPQLVTLQEVDELPIARIREILTRRQELADRRNSN
jgi:hypothetical protein